MKTYRIYSSYTLHSIGQHIKLDGKGYHHYKNVLRLKRNDYVLLFDGENGLWKAQLIEITSQALIFLLVEHIQIQPLPEKPLILYFSPIKEQTHLISMATALGVTEFYPICCDRTVANWHPIKMQQVIMDTLEQCGRLDIPLLHVCENFKQVLFSTPFYYADCNDKKSLSQKFLSSYPKPINSVFIGPEGGYTQNERNLLQHNPLAVSLSLGGRILRSELASIVALTLLKYKAL